MMEGIAFAVGFICLITAMIDMGMNGSQYAYWAPWGLGIAFVLFIAGSALGRDLTIPNPEVTPGVARDLSIEQICSTRWGRDKRAVTSAMKKQVFHNYSLKGNGDGSQACKLVKGRRYEIDHKYPRCAGGADDTANLWPQCYSGAWNATMKDRLEVLACKKICTDELTPEEARSLFDDWHEAYIKYFGQPK